MRLTDLRHNRYFPVAVFLTLYAVFYFGNKAFTGVTVPGNVYIPFLDEHFNYVKVFREFLLQCSAFIIRLFGHTTFIHDYGIKMENGKGIRLIYACMGFAIFSFWWAMILAFPQSLKNKLIFFLGGTIVIIFLNVLRIALVAVVFNSDWGRAHHNIDHHLIFNIIVYGILFYMLYRWFNLKDPYTRQVNKPIA